MQERPEIITRFAERGCVGGGEAPGRVVLEQRGTMRLKPDGRWLDFTAEQWASESEVAFCWHARVKMAPLLTAVVEDALEAGHGRLDVKMWGAIPVAHEEGAEIDRGEAQRYLAELAWNPMALLHNPDLRFDEGPAGSVRVWVGEPSCYVDLHFDERGDVVRTHSETRVRGDEGAAPWEGVFEDYGAVGDLRCPRRGHVSWHLPEGRFRYWRGEIVSCRRVTAP